MATRFKAAKGRNRQRTAQADFVLGGHTPALAPRRKADRLQQQAGHDAESVVNLEQINIAAVHVGLAEGIVGRLSRGKEVERILPVVESKPIGGNTGAKNFNRLVGVSPRLVTASQNNGCRTITDG